MQLSSLLVGFVVALLLPALVPAPTPSPLPCLVGVMPEIDDIGAIKTSYVKSVIANRTFGAFHFSSTDDGSTVDTWNNTYAMTLTNPLGSKKGGVKEKWLFTVNVGWWNGGSGPRMTKISLPKLVATHKSFHPVYDFSMRVMRLITSDGNDLSVGILKPNGDYNMLHYFPNILVGQNLNYFGKNIYMNRARGQIHIWVWGDKISYQALTIDVTTGQPGKLTLNFPEKYVPPVTWHEESQCYLGLTNVTEDGKIEISSYCLNYWAVKTTLYSPKSGLPMLKKSDFNMAELYFAESGTIFFTKVGDGGGNTPLYLAQIQIRDMNSLQYKEVGDGWFNPSLADTGFCPCC